MAELRDIVLRIQRAKALRRKLMLLDERDLRETADVMAGDVTTMCDRAVGWIGGYDDLQEGVPHSLMFAALAIHLILNGEDLTDLKRTP